MLATVGIDTNSDIYFIAYVVIESENEASWCWFLELLLLDLEIVKSYQISFMFNKQKKVSFKTKAFKYLLWKAARLSTQRDFDDAMAELKNTNEDAYDWLKGKNLAHWSRSHFSLKSKSNMLVNNLCECFNKMIFEVRRKPILTMIETIRTKIMLLIVNKKEEAENFKRNLCPKIKKKLATNIKDLISFKRRSSLVAIHPFRFLGSQDTQLVLVTNTCCQLIKKLP
ncbi:hypothetical protein J1N35_004950 [Gossypium stocksii]|uniref:MULE transposase domain-containing protein n=1 Tax=Gossypium stocksii TaxID=47602 RepID=A0A9D4AIT6_9ROSI|nr:hypothetical protein J1N35_004950 [Gossypium stocksii]